MTHLRPPTVEIIEVVEQLAPAITCALWLNVTQNWFLKRHNPRLDQQDPRDSHLDRIEDNIHQLADMFTRAHVFVKPRSTKSSAMGHVPKVNHR